MKKVPMFFTLFLFFVQGYGQSNVSDTERSVLLSLQAGETLMNYESCFTLTMSGKEIFLVTKQNNKFFTYDNGQRNGPFNTIQGSMLKKCSSANNSEEKCAVYKSPTASQQPEGLTTNNSGQYQINFKNKTFGPFQFIKNYVLLSDKSGFVAIAMDSQMNSTLVTSDGKQIPLKGDVEDIMVSPTGNKYVFALKEREPMNLDLMKDMSKMTQDELLKFAKDMEEKQKKAGPPKAFVYTSTGEKLGPFDQHYFGGNNPFYSKSGGENWMMVMDNVLYVNGQKMKEFANTDLSSCNIWLSKDGKRYAITSYNKILFSDGKSYGYPMETMSYEKNGKTFIKWISLENGKDLVLYTREL